MHIRETFSKFFADRGTHLAAMIAYFALLSFVPLIFLALALLGLGGRTTESSYFVEELQKVRISDLLVHTCSMLASLAFGKLAPETRDLEQARLGIDALKALGPLLEEGPQRDIQQVVANLQLVYAEAAAPTPES